MSKRSTVHGPRSTLVAREQGLWKSNEEVARKRSIGAWLAVLALAVVSLWAHDARAYVGAFSQDLGAVLWRNNNGKIYWYKGGEYVRFTKVSEGVDSGYPKPIAGSWPGLPASFLAGIDAAMWSFSNGRIYLFHGDQYVRYTNVRAGVDSGYPKPIAGNWPGLPASFNEGIDAALFRKSNGKVYLFKGDQYVRYTKVSSGVDSGYPKPIAGNWPGLPASFNESIDAAFFHRANGKIYMFKGDQYVRYTNVGAGIDPGYPKPIAENWLGELGDPPPPPGAGLQSEILSVSAGGDGTVTVTFTLTDDAGVPVRPVLARTSDPDEARVRFTIARLEVDEQNLEGLTTTFTRYVNYVTRTQTSPITGDSSEQPTYDSGGSVVPLDSSAGTYLYIFGTALPEGFPASLTHTVGAQIERTFDERDLVANPTSDFVPDGGPVSVVREPTTTAQCNSCHNPLALHGSGRREVSLCKLCHTSQAVDPDTGNTIEFAPMVHSIHRGRELPSVDGGVVGTKYSIIGYRQSEHVYAERVQACEGGPFASAVCTSDADCGEGGTCTDEKTAGVGFPQDLRNCGKCHTDGSTAANHLENPSSSACVGCHDNVNPSLVETGAGPPGFLHLAGPQPEAACRLCHVAQGPEFGISVAGAHTIPARSQQLAGLEAEILSAVGAPGGSLQMEFRILDGGAPVSDIGGAGLNRIAIALSGPNTDFGAFDPPLIRPTVFGSGSSGVLSGPDPLGVFTYETDETLPEDAYGTWRVGLEARRSVELLDPFGAAAASATEAVQNPVLDFSVDGSPLAPRREVAGMDNCGECHGTFSKGFNIHGSLRNQSDYCVICHNPSMSDFARRNPAVTDENASVVNEPIGFKHMIHKIHTGEELESKPYIIYGFGFPFTPHEFSEVRFPGNRADCATCHVNDSHLLPLDEGLLPTLQTIVDAGTELVVGSIPVIQDACLACHGSMEAQAHADTYTSELGEESCGNCHNEGAFKAVSEVHAHHLD